MGEQHHPVGGHLLPLLSAVGASFPSEAADWLTVSAALRRILAGAGPLPTVDVPLAEATGRILAEPIDAVVTLPPWDNAAMDGYVVRASDFPADDKPFELPVAGEIRAGEPPVDAPPPGHALRIMTGSPVPRGMDSVVRVEDTDREEGAAGTVRVRSHRDRGRNVRPGGRDMAAGERLLEAGEAVTPGRVALLAAAGRDPVPVVPTPRVALIPTGDELRTPDDFDDVEAGVAIPESNGPTLRAACQAVGIPARVYDPVRDERAALGSTLEDARGWADVVVTLGGASMGTADLVKVVLDEMDFELDFWRVRMRPGSPFSFGHLPRDGAPALPVFGLPGNPASAFVTFQVLVRPFLLALAGHSAIHRPVVEALAGERFGAHPERALFPRVTLEIDDAGGLVARTAGLQNSGLVRSLAPAHGLGAVPPGDPLPAGSPLDVIVLDDGPGGSPRPAWLPDADGEAE